MMRLVAIMLLLAAMAANAMAQVASEDIETYTADFDWLSATNGRHEFAEGLLTLNRLDLERFVPTGEFSQRLHFGALEIEKRDGVYFSTEEFDDTSLDEPASVLVRHKDRILAGAKGLFFNIDIAGNYLRIEHWNGEPGCTLSRWYLEFKFIGESRTPSIRVVESEFADLLSEEPCEPDQ